jgi:hypothetical protein
VTWTGNSLGERLVPSSGWMVESGGVSETCEKVKF